MRDLIESGFRVAVVKDATAAILPGLNGYEAALVNFQMIAKPRFTTEEIVTDIKIQKKIKNGKENKHKNLPTDTNP
jgi:nicotinamidase-related amidase